MISSTPRPSRVNGFTWPIHPMQVVSIIVKMYLSIVVFGQLVWSFDSPLINGGLLLIFGIAISMMFISTFIVTHSDPADNAVRMKIRSTIRPPFNREVNAHVISHDQYCTICLDIVNETSKHCRQCNKCVTDFDHHCKWLNNCIGARNYRWFIIYVNTIVVGSFAIAAVCITVWIMYAFESTKLAQCAKHSVGVGRPSFGDCRLENLWLGLHTSITVISIVSFALTAHLLYFHLKLIASGLTTYSFVMSMKNDPPLNQTQTSSVNTIAPSMHEERHELAANLYNPRGSTTPITTVSYQVSPQLERNGKSKQAPNGAHVNSAFENDQGTQLTLLSLSKPEQMLEKIYEPHVEHVIGKNGNEMELPSIMVKSPSVVTSNGSAIDSPQTITPSVNS